MNKAEEHGSLKYSKFQGMVSSSKEEFGFSIERGDNGDMELKRFLACFMTSIMPDECIQEVLVSLSDILEFHKENAQYKISGPSPIYKTTGKVVGISERPGLVITE